jgi:F-type H+-transporting ATPase subunit delta
VAERATLARPYAKAAFDQAKAEGKAQEWSSLLEFLAALAADPVMQRVIRNPKVSGEQLSGLLVDLCAERVTPTGHNFLRLLVDAGRLDVAAEIRDQFQRRRLRDEGRANVDVVAAFELDESQKGRIRDLMAKRLGLAITLSTTVDNGLIGGAVIRSGDSVIDASVRGRLRELGNQLAD